MTISIPCIRRSEIGVRFHLSLVRKGPYLLFIIRNNSQDIGITDIRLREWRDWHTKWVLDHTEIPYWDRDNYSGSVTYIPSEALNSSERSLQCITNVFVMLEFIWRMHYYVFQQFEYGFDSPLNDMDYSKLHHTYP